jgi:methionyl-tRNA formyltransferase
VSRVRICFLGTPEFAVVSLRHLVQDEHFEVVGVVTQPDRPAGRKMLMTPSPIKQFALAKGLKCMAPEKIGQDLILEEIRKWSAEVAVVVAYGQILSQRFLDLFPRGAVNLHGSLLPNWRGAAPIQRSIEAGESQTGVCLQKIVKELDAGDLLGSRKLTVGENDTAKEIHDRLAELGTELLHLELMDYLRGNLAPVPQDHSQVTYAKKINKSECRLNWNLAAWSLHNKVRAFTFGPGTWTEFLGKKIKIHRTHWGTPGPPYRGNSGELCLHDGLLWVHAGDQWLQLVEVQLESKNRVTGQEFALQAGIQASKEAGEKAGEKFV